MPRLEAEEDAEAISMSMSLNKPVTVTAMPHPCNPVKQGGFYGKIWN